MPPTEDVTTVETTTTAPSTENETTTVDAAPAASTEEAHGDSVPEINRLAERARKAEKELEALRNQQAAYQAPADPNEDHVKAELNRMGYLTQAQLDAKLAERDEDLRVDRELTALTGKYNGSDGRPKFDRQKVLQYAIDNGIGNAEVAYKAMNEAALTDWAVQQAVSKTRGVQSEGSDGSGSSQVGVTTEDLKANIRKGDQGALKTLIRRVTAPEG